MRVLGAFLRAAEMAEVCSSGDPFGFFVASIGEWGKNGDLVGGRGAARKWNKRWGSRGAERRRYFRRCLRKPDRARRHRVIDSAARRRVRRVAAVFCSSVRRVHAVHRWACAARASPRANIRLARLRRSRNFPARYYCVPHKICVYALSNMAAPRRR